jgi:hypothetical protein
MNTQEHHQVILKHVVAKGGMGNVMEALQWDVSRFDEGFAIALDIQNLDYVKLLYSNFNKNLIVVELTLVGLAKGRE